MINQQQQILQNECMLQNIVKPIIQQIDENTLKEIQTFSRCQVAIKNEEKKVIEKQEKQGKQERQEKETTKRTTEVDPFEKLVNINMQIEQCLELLQSDLIVDQIKIMDIQSKIALIYYIKLKQDRK